MEYFESAWNDLVSLPADPPEVRKKCSNCSRPLVACWCSSLPAKPLVTMSTVVILQHPAEQKRCLRTAEMLSKSLLPGKCLVYRGKRFPQARHTGLADILGSQDSICVYPSKDAIDIETLPKVNQRNGAGYNLIIIDGTWPQAKAIYHNTKELHKMTQVKLSHGESSQYIIRSQPAVGCLSTVEAAASALVSVEGDSGLRTALLAPLALLCRVQLAHGAVVHDKIRSRQSRGLQL